MYLADIRDYVASLGIANDDNVYMGKLTDKKNCSIGVYHLSRNTESPTTPIGGIDNASYGIKPISILIHWNTSPRDTEIVSQGLFNALRDVKNVTINDQTILFTNMLVSEPKDVGTDDNGIYEMVIQLEFYYER